MMDEQAGNVRPAPARRSALPQQHALGRLAVAAMPIPAVIVVDLIDEARHCPR